MDQIVKQYVEKKSVKTTINIDENLWNDFRIKVIKERGGRKANEVIAELIKKFLQN